jgi:hypothetical protein
VRVLEASKNGRLAAEFIDPRFVLLVRKAPALTSAGDGPFQYLDSNRSLQLGILSSINGAEGALTQKLTNHIVADLLGNGIVAVVRGSRSRRG